MDLFDLLISFEVVAGVVCGILAAALVHWIAPEPKPVVVEALLVVAGFAGGLLWGYEPGKPDA